ncbi:MAG: glycosyl transferase family 36, partial [Eubacteriales bacterium]|nr:glycosyl transferase family 36 [Eubacteriales bacterium]
CGDEETAELLAETYTRKQVARVVCVRSRRYWRDIVEKLQVYTPDEAFNVMMNGWLIYQTLSCRIISRTGFYQSGGAYGFRDQLQDSLAIMLSHPEITRQLIVKFCSRQFKEGDVQHWWHDDEGKGIRTKISDDLLWLPYVTAAYIKCTGETSILEENVSYLQDRELSLDEQEIYTAPEVSEEKGSVYEHCCRAIDRSLKFGKHGLPLIGTGDWNDGMNSVGDEGCGESVWLAWFIRRVLVDFIEVCKLKDDTNRIKKYLETAAELVKNVEEHAWDGEWYMRAFFDNGEPLGSRNNTECRIDSISQSWSVLSGAGDPERARKAMASLNKYLVKEEDRIILLLTPPFDRMEPNPGYIMGYLPGIRENGGQYTHAAIWACMAYAELGMGDEAFRLHNMINPVMHALNYSDAMKYKAEPYVISADVYSMHPHAGRAGWSWYTGSAGWLYKAGLESILGFKKEGNKLYIKPSVPVHWKYYSINYKYGESNYRIDVKDPTEIARGSVSLMLDGKILGTPYILLQDDGQYHSAFATGDGFGSLPQ